MGEETDKADGVTPKATRVSFRQVFLEKWAPAILVALIGAVAVPWLQTTFANRTELAKRRLQLWESIGEDFTDYIKSRGRLNAVGSVESSNVIFNDRKEEYRRNRDEYSDAMERDLLLAEFYFNKKVTLEIEKFLTWHEQYRNATVEKLPPDKEYLDYRRAIMSLIKDEL
jgi:hypothetical protein